MKLKQTRQLTLTQLNEYAFKKEIKDKDFFTQDGKGYVSFDDEGNFIVSPYQYLVLRDKLFEIEEEIEINADTIFKVIIVVTDNNTYIPCANYSINMLLNSVHHEGKGTKFIYLQNEDGSIGDLIWKDEKMVE